MTISKRHGLLFLCWFTYIAAYLCRLSYASALPGQGRNLSADGGELLMTVLERIKEKYLSMSGTEKRIADAILENPGRAVNMTVKYLASKARVSDGSVMKFAGSLGYGGFTKLKIALAMGGEEFKGCAFENVYSGDSVSAALRKMGENASKPFADTCAHIPSDALEKAARLLMDARKIEVYGMGGSGFIAGDAAYRPMRIGL